MARRGPAIIGLDGLNKTFSQLSRAFGPGADVSEHLEAGADVLQESIQEQIAARNLIDTEDLLNSVEVVPVGPRQVNVESDSPYSAAHEFGVTVTITDKQRRFFWAQYFDTKDDMWFALALSKTYTIPAKPYWRPAVDRSKKEIANAVAKSMLDALLKFRRK